MSAAAKPKQNRKRAPIYMVVARAGDVPKDAGVLVPLTQWDKRAMRERKLFVGTEVRAELKQPRNVKWWRLAHVLGAWLVDNVEGFEGLSMHDAVKKLQALSGIGCIEETFDLGELGVVKRRVAESLNFDDMDEGRWAELWDGGTGEGGWIGWLRREKWGALSAEQIEDVEAIIVKDPA